MKIELILIIILAIIVVIMSLGDRFIGQRIKNISIVRTGGKNKPRAKGFLQKLVDKYSGQRLIKVGTDSELRSLVDTEGLVDPGEFTFTREGIFSISPPARARQLTDIIAGYYPDPSKITITDATSCNGGDAIAFAKKFGHVNAVEINDDNYTALDNNVKLYGFKNVETHHADYLAILGDLHQDVVHMDPPWGGLDYKDQTNLHLRLGDTDVEQVVARLSSLPKPPHISLKVPYNFAKDSLFAIVPNWRHEVHDMRKFYLLQLIPPPM